MTHARAVIDAEVEITIFISCFNEEQTIGEFHTRLSTALEALGRPYEIVFVNDGSGDATLERLKDIFARDPHVRAVVELFRNSGQAAAITAGLQFARGDAILFLDSDLQLDPADLPALYAEFSKGRDMATGYRVRRRDPITRVVPSIVANAIMRRVSKSNVRDFGCTFKLFDARLVRAFEFSPFKPLAMPYLISRAGRIGEVPVSHSPRRAGRSGWTFGKLFRYNMDNFVGISESPFQALAFAGFFCALLFLLRIVLMKAVPFSILRVVTNGLVLNVLLFTFLVTLAILAAIGEFTIRGYRILSRYPAFVVKEVIQR